MFNFVTQPPIIWERIDFDAVLPIYSTTNAAAMDMFSIHNVMIPSKDKREVRIGLKAKLPKGYCLVFHSRSGMSFKHSIEHGAGLIDEDYRDEIKVVLYNHGFNSYQILKGDRVVQAVLTPFLQGKNIWGDVDEDENSNRLGGIGSSGR